MKKSILLIFSIVTMFVIMSCSTMMGGVFIPNLTVETQTIETIDGITTRNQLKIRNEKDFLQIHTWTLLFEEFITPNSTFHTIKIIFFGPEWEFYETIGVKTDKQISKLTDDNPSRVIRSGGDIIETISVILGAELIEEIQNTS